MAWHATVRRITARGLCYPLLLSLLLAAPPVAALSLGDMVVRSVPGQPLRGHIPITLQDGESLEELEVRLASDEEYAQQRKHRAEVLRGLRIALINKGEGLGRVQFFGRETWHGDAALLLLSVKWPKGEMVLPYRLTAITQAVESSPLYVEVAQDESLDAIAIRLSKGRNRSYLHMMYALFKANPEAFYRGNMNNLKSGARLRVPSETELFRLTNHEVFSGIRRQYAEWQQMRESKQRPGSEAGAALAAMSEEQAERLDLSGDATELLKRLQQVRAVGARMERENDLLRQRLQELEQRAQTMAAEVLDDSGSVIPASVAAAVPVPAAESVERVTPQPQPIKEEKPAVKEKEAEATSKGQPGEGDTEGEKKRGLPAWGLWLAIALVLASVYYLYATTPRGTRKEDELGAAL